MIIKLPLSVTLPRRKGVKIWLCNLNTYRNTHYILLNQVKQAWKGIVANSIPEFINREIQPPLRFVYTVHKGDGRAYDVANICSIVDKFTCDSLEELEIIKNDNHKIITEVIYRAGVIDKANPHVELEIQTI